MATKQIAWQTGSGYITLTYQGQGDGPISVVSDPNDVGSARSKTITIETTNGGLVTKNVTVSQAACPFPVGDVKNYSYTGSYQEVELPAGQYKLQCWGAQGGSNGTNSTYGITAKAGGKGGYSEGIITLSQKTTVRVYVGGKGSASAGGFNGGGSTTGTSQYNSGNEFGYSKMGGGGGATDIRLNSGSLYSRMIVAGGGSGGAMAYRAVTTSTTEEETKQGSSLVAEALSAELSSTSTYGSNINWGGDVIDVSRYRGWNYTITKGSSSGIAYIFDLESSYPTPGTVRNVVYREALTGTVPSNACWMWVAMNSGAANPGSRTPQSIKFYHTVPSTTTSTNSQVGYVGGGTTGGGYDDNLKGKQNAAGAGASFGEGAEQTATNHRYTGAGGGGGWYGGGGSFASDSNFDYIKLSGGGSGFVNVAANTGIRPSGYTGLELDTGETRDGNTSFPAPGGGTETGHEGNGYARITRLA